MKLRIKGSSIRLRLTKAEVAECQANQYLADSVDLPGGKGFQYAIKGIDQPEIEVEWEHHLCIGVPRDILRAWSSTQDQIGIYRDLSIDETRTLRLVIERDFKCLDQRVGENEDDLFTNPKSIDG